MTRATELMALNPDITPEILDQVDAIINRYRQKPGSLIPVLEQCQETLGYIPVELQEYVGSALNIPGSTIFGVVTFYSFFSMVPKGRHIIKVCMGTACYVRGIKEVLNRLRSTLQLEVGHTTADRRFSLEAVRCLGACGIAPVVVVDGDAHGSVTPDGVLSLLEQYE
jgi:NADH-quinone oxidoreductase subunit E